MGHEAFEHATAGGAPPGGPGFEGFGETIFGDAFNGGVDEVIFWQFYVLCITLVWWHH
jgi:molecular chaperone DnaJ